MVYTSNSKDNSYTPTYSCQGNNVLFTITDYEPATSSNELIITYNHLPQGGGGVGGDFGKTIGIYNISKRACELTYEPAKTKDYTKINELMEILSLEGENFVWTDLKKYIDNWQPLCSDITNTTLNPEEVCKKIFFFILGNNYKYDLVDLNDLRNSLNTKVSLSLLRYYIDNFEEKCVKLNYSESLPKKPSDLDSIIKKYFPDCETELTGLFGLSFPFPNINIGDLSCKSVNFWRFAFKLEKSEYSYTITKIKVWWIVLLIFLIIIIKFIKSNKKMDNVLKKWG